MVLATQEELIASIRPGVTSVDSLYKDMQVRNFILVCLRKGELQIKLVKERKS